MEVAREVMIWKKNVGMNLVEEVVVKVNVSIHLHVILL
jgi:hypothetical protein